MNPTFDFVSSDDKPALLALSTPAWLATAKTALTELGYKVQTAATHSDFLIRFSQTRYQVVVIEELFGASLPGENIALKTFQQLPASQRRHTTAILIGNSFQTYAPMEAFQHSVHAVINSSELVLLKPLIAKAVSDNLEFYRSFREVHHRVVASGRSD